MAISLPLIMIFASLLQVPYFRMTRLHTTSENHQNISRWPFLQHVGTICDSPTILQMVSTPLWGIFAPLKVFPFSKHLDLVAFFCYNYDNAHVLKTFFVRWSSSCFLNYNLVTSDLILMLFNIFIKIKQR